MLGGGTYLGENVVNEKEYRSAIFFVLKVYGVCLWEGRMYGGEDLGHVDSTEHKDGRNWV